MSCDKCGSACVGKLCAECDIMNALADQYGCLTCGSPAAPGYDYCMECEDQEELA